MNALVLASSADRKTWLEARKLGIGSSDASAICGLSPYSTPYSVWLDKTGQEPEREASEAMEMGNKLEPVIASLFEERTGLSIEHAGKLMQHHQHAWMIATPDYCVTEGGKLGLLEIKLTGSWFASDWQDKLPDHAHIQVTHQLAVTGLTFAYVCALVGGTSLKWMRVERDEPLIDQLIKIESDFWHNHVLTKVPPPMASGDNDLMGQLFGTAQPGKAIELDATAEAAAAEYLAAKQALKAAEKEVDRIEANLKASLGDAETAHAGAYRISWKNQSRTSIDSKALKQYHPLIAEQCSRVSSFRKFDVKELKTED